jgi:proline dehydrogenase
MNPMRNLMRNALLAASQSAWLRQRAPRLKFVRRTVARFMPGETLDDAIAASRQLQSEGIGAVFTQLGENVTSASQARMVTGHYLSVLERIRREQLPAEISVKLTHLGLDVSPEICYANLREILENAGGVTVWLDMEGSAYVDATLDLYRRARSTSPRVGVCLQAYLYRTAQDLESLLPIGAAIRLVKGAYSEPPQIAYPRKRDVDENYFTLTRRLLSPEAKSAGVRVAIATHDKRLIRRITALVENGLVENSPVEGGTTESAVESNGRPRSALEFQMLYGIQREEQRRLARQGWRSTVLIAYGAYWFPWFMRRLAERPANVMFIVRNLFVG